MDKDHGYNQALVRGSSAHRIRGLSAHHEMANTVIVKKKHASPYGAYLQNQLQNQLQKTKCKARKPKVVSAGLGSREAQNPNLLHHVMTDDTNNKRPKSIPPTGDEHAKLKT